MSKRHAVTRRSLVEGPSLVTGLYGRLKRIMKDRGILPKHLSLAAGLGETGVRDMFKAKKAPRIDTVLKIAEQLGITIGELVDGDQPKARRIPIIGCVSAGEGWSYFDGDGPIDEVLLEIDVGDAVGLDIKGNSMEPVYRDGDILIGTKRIQPESRQLIGQDCIVETKDRRRYVKFVARGSVRGRFNLRSYNPAHEDVRDVEISWAAPISIVIRSQR